MPTPHYDRFELTTAPLDEGTVLLEASAGTGKTYTITGILVRMLLEGVVEHVEQALVVTFTVAAADELKNRLRNGIHRALAVCLGGDDDDEFFRGLAGHGKRGANRLRRALDEFDRSSVMTIHGFCKRLLEESAFESEQQFELDFAVDATPLWQAAASDAVRSVREHESPMLGAALQLAALPPDELVKLYRNWRRYPDVALDPSPPQLGVHLANLRAAVHQAASLWDDELRDVVLGFEWRRRLGRSLAPGNGDLEGYLERNATALRDEPEHCLAFLDTLSPTQMDNRVPQRERFKLQHNFFAACEDVHEHWQIVLDHLRADLLLRMEQRLHRHKQERAVLTFDDLLERTHAALRDPDRSGNLLQAVQARYRVALIDEFQDTDTRQYEILSTVFANKPLFLVGDPKQSIYGFRGADLHTYLAAAGDALQKNTLTTNYRSSRKLVQSVNQLFGRAGAFVEHDIRMHKVRANAGPSELQLEDPDGPAALRFRCLELQLQKRGVPEYLSADESRRRIVADVTAEIVRLLSAGIERDGAPLLPRHIAVLTRRNVEAVMVQESLRAAGVVSVIGKAGDVFETDELVELERLMVAILRPNDLMRARAALTTRLWGHDAASLQTLHDDEGSLERELDRLDRWRQLWIHRGFFAMKEQLLQDLDAEGRLLRRADGERRLTNLQQLCEMLHQAEHEHRLSPEGLLHWLQHERQHKDEIDYQRRELRLESDEDAVQILTMHGSKGLEYDVVFCPFLWDGRNERTSNVALPAAPGGDAAATRRFVFRTDKDDEGWQRLEADRLAEDVRLAYVALTRAKRRCYVHWGPIGSNFGGYHWSALAWLLAAQPGDDKPGWQLEWGKRYRNESATMYDDLQRVAAAVDGAIRTDFLPESAPTVTLARPSAATTESPERSPRRRPRDVPWRRPIVVHSFTSLVAGAAHTDATPDVRDPAAAEPTTDGDGIFGFARGADAGQCLHTILEHVDLSALDATAARERVERTLAAHGLLDPGSHPSPIDPVAAVLANLAELAAARVGDDGPTVRELCSGPRAIEWKFTLPITVPDLQALAAAFAASDCEIARGYAERLQHLAPQRFAGFLTGFADLIAEHDGHYWIVDWKSNHLGNAIADYDGPATLAAMHQHDYVLQYHLYVLAWHRHLRARLADYDYDRHFGGVCYAFLRGAVAGGTDGMFCSRPPLSLVDAIDRWATGEPDSKETR